MRCKDNRKTMLLLISVLLIYSSSYSESVAPKEIIGIADQSKAYTDEGIYGVGENNDNESKNGNTNYNLETTRSSPKPSRTSLIEVNENIEEVEITKIKTDLNPLTGTEWEAKEIIQLSSDKRVDTFSDDTHTNANISWFAYNGEIGPVIVLFLLISATLIILLLFDLCLGVFIFRKVKNIELQKPHKKEEGEASRFASVPEIGNSTQYFASSSKMDEEKIPLITESPRYTTHASDIDPSLYSKWHKSSD